MSLTLVEAKMPSLRNKLEEKAVAEKAAAVEKPKRIKVGAGQTSKVKSKKR